MKKLQVDFRYLVEVLAGATLSRHDTLMIPAGKKVLAIDLILAPVFQRMLTQRRREA